MTKKPLLLFVAVAAIVVAIYVLETRKQKEAADVPVSVAYSLEIAPQGVDAKRIAEKKMKYERAKEFISPEGYVNTEPFRLSDVIGKKVILIDFWTYSCINCQRTLPYLTAWDAKYGPEGLLIIGVHAPEFGFEKVYDNVAAAVKKAGIRYPVILDNAHANMRLYDTLYWPTKYLIDIDGFIVDKHVGEGGYGQTEQVIRRLLEERRRVLHIQEATPSGSLVKPHGAEDVDFGSIGTPEIYLGAETTRGNFGSPEGLEQGRAVRYVLPEAFTPNQVYLGGEWFNDADHLRLQSATGKLVLIYNAKSVNLVAGAPGAGARLLVKIDGRYIGQSYSCEDVGEGGMIKVSGQDIYHIVCGQGYGRHKLEIEVDGPGLSVYAFTFG
ncbi:MAG: redoxin domain-containing protein [Candidatus Omnitrophica bacterium]|nr:redoxin domain-containing protein [Candidatus Omnitrophota bacterium]MDD5138215.1 redoxin domain-containing protein [Candidatus Omnitrophota bacterium]